MKEITAAEEDTAAIYLQGHALGSVLVPLMNARKARFAIFRKGINSDQVGPQMKAATPTQHSCAGIEKALTTLPVLRYGSGHTNREKGGLNFRFGPR